VFREAKIFFYDLKRIPFFQCQGNEPLFLFVSQLDSVALSHQVKINSGNF